MIGPRAARTAVILICAVLLGGALPTVLEAAAAPVVNDRYPGAEWTEAASPQAMGWSTEGLAAVGAYVERVQSAAVVIVDRGVVVASWGAVDHGYNVASLRKSLLSALIGIAVERGEIDPRATLAELGIDDVPPALTEAEKQARVVDLMTTRSGVYHRAAFEPRGMKDRRPERGSHPPGTFFFYNNWDFNTLGTIYERGTGRKIFEAFGGAIAAPLGMQDYRAEDGRYVTQDVSEHSAYLFRISARDLARFGLLFLREGRWRDAQIVPAAWVHESTTAHVDSWRGGYGYMWWVETEGHHYKGLSLPPGTFIARGAGGHHLVVMPALDLVVVHMGETDRPAPGNWTGEEEVAQLLALVLDARTDTAPR